MSAPTMPRNPVMHSMSRAVATCLLVRWLPTEHSACTATHFPVRAAPEDALMARSCGDVGTVTASQETDVAGAGGLEGPTARDLEQHRPPANLTSHRSNSQQSRTELCSFPALGVPLPTVAAGAAAPLTTHSTSTSSDSSRAARPAPSQPDGEPSVFHCAARLLHSFHCGLPANFFGTTANPSKTGLAPAHPAPPLTGVPDPGGGSCADHYDHVREEDEIVRRFNDSLCLVSRAGNPIPSVDSGVATADHRCSDKRDDGAAAAGMGKKEMNDDAATRITAQLREQVANALAEVRLTSERSLSPASSEEEPGGRSASQDEPQLSRSGSTCGGEGSTNKLCRTQRSGLLRGGSMLLEEQDEDHDQKDHGRGGAVVKEEEATEPAVVPCGWRMRGLPSGTPWGSKTRSESSAKSRGRKENSPPRAGGAAAVGAGEAPGVEGPRFAPECNDGDEEVQPARRSSTRKLSLVTTGRAAAGILKPSQGGNGTGST